MSSTCRGGRGGGGVLFYKMRSISIINYLFRTLLHPLTLKVSTSVILLAGSASTGLSGLVSLHVCSCNLNLIIDSVFNFSLLTSYVQQIKRGKCLVNCDRPTRRPTNQPTDGYESANKNALQLSDFLIKIRRIKMKFVRGFTQNYYLVIFYMELRSSNYFGTACSAKFTPKCKRTVFRSGYVDI